MMRGALIGAIAAVVVLVFTTFKNRAAAKNGTGLPGQVDQALRGKPAQNLAALSALVGMRTLRGRGKVAQALEALRAVGKVKINPAPAGTPRLEKVDVITYEAV